MQSKRNCVQMKSAQGYGKPFYETPFILGV